MRPACYTIADMCAAAGKKDPYAGMMSEQAFWKAADSRSLSGAYLLFGEEELTKQLAVNKVISLLDPAAKDMNLLTVKPSGARELQLLCTQLPFFDSLRVLLLREWDSGLAKELTEGKKGEKCVLETVDAATVLLIVMRGEEKADAIFKWFEKNGAARAVHFAPLTEDRACGMLQREAAVRGVKLDKITARKLVSLCGTDGYRLKNEFSKAADSIAPGETVTEEVILRTVHPNPETTAFEILDLLLAGKRKQGMAFLERELRDDAGSAFAYAGLFLSRLKPLLKARLLLDAGKKPAEAEKLLGGGYYYRRIVDEAQKRDAATLRSTIIAFAAVDSGTKQGTFRPEEGLLLAIQKLF